MHTSAPPPPRPHEFYLIASNMMGRKNLGTFLRTGSAFGVKQVLVVGSDRFGTHGGHNAHKYVEVLTFHTCDEVYAYLKARNCRILGLHSSTTLKNMDTSMCLDKDAEFAPSTAFVLGNEGGDLSPEQRGICDGFIHLPHFKPRRQSPSTSLFEVDLTVQLGILLHRFTTWSGQYTERGIEDTSTRGKFALAERAPRHRTEHPTVTLGRQAKKEAVEAIMEDDLDLQLFGES
ncbi:hypothetical protein H310_12464 [Aphanomyces invadans]|uniref:tRNA/rRNA methyltransferase SpoU type domain-containing protein n=1 Tax=Aphanomyces invadans TaxID=157072 RepID=A0A024TI09_9STRA|nr:hypothetical protein H310_12464 [Aphanomyces invadans]ETV93698.1 hypothetical protein H310_12464 [Aphanomyces invadans]|eukprot:XP_008877739.1 hypothetical protein H310_12464 [Aphanomyces invadans]